MLISGYDKQQKRVSKNFFDTLFGNSDFKKLFSSVLSKVAKFLFDAEKLVVLGHSV